MLMLINFYKGYFAGKCLMKNQLPEKEAKFDASAGEDVVYQGKKYAQFSIARDFVHSLKLKNINQWYQYCHSELAAGTPPETIPVFPDEVYKEHGWAGWNDWLYNPHKGKRQFRNFKKARKFARTLGLTSRDQWSAFCKGDLPEKRERPSDIPSNPPKIYKNKGWVSWGDWLGTGRIANQKKKFLPFVKAKELARKLKLKGSQEWRELSAGRFPGKQIPDNIPVSPEQTYKLKGWISWGDFLGTGNISCKKMKFLSFIEARSFARKLKLNSSTEWRELSAGRISGKQIPDDIPSAPNQTYKHNGWISWGDFLGTGRIADQKKKFRSFAKARSFARKLKLNSSTEWRELSAGRISGKQIPDDIPSAPDQIYKNKGWISWGDFLGTGRIADQKKKFHSFAKARSFARKLKLNSAKEWRVFCRDRFIGKGQCPPDIPSAPDQFYKNKGWISWYDWLGKSK